MPTIDIYGNMISCPCRAVWMTCLALGVEVNIIKLKAPDQTQTVSFLKKNFHNGIPRINDDGFILWESRTIMRYLVSKYGKTDELYPKDLRKRTVVERLMDFDAGTLYAALLPACSCKTLLGIDPPSGCDERVDEIIQEMEANSALWESDFMTGPVPTIADLSIMASLTILETTKYDFTRFTKLNAWRARMKALPYYGPTTVDLEKFWQFASTPEWTELQAARRALAAAEKESLSEK